MDFKSLHCFAELVRLQSFSAAASALTAHSTFQQKLSGRNHSGNQHAESSPTWEGV